MYKKKKSAYCDVVRRAPQRGQRNGAKSAQGLRRNGFDVSLSTIYRIARDLVYKWTKPWHTDVLTPAQKLKRKLFCAQYLRLSEPEMLRTIAEWMFSDEKWWDIVGPACYKWKKAPTKMEAKMQNQVIFFYCCLLFVACLAIDHNFCIVLCIHNRCLETRARRAG